MQHLFTKKNIGLVLLFVLIFLIRYNDGLFSYKIVNNAKDGVYLLGPTFHKIAATIKLGEIPLRIPEMMCGMPYYNNALFSATYPFYFFGTVEYGVGIELLRTMMLITLLHLCILFLNTTLLLRMSGVEWLYSILGASGVIIAANTLHNVTWIITACGYSWLPLFFAGIIYIFRKPESWLGAIVLGLSAVGFLAKPAQTAILTLFFGAIIFFAGAIWHRKQWKQLLPKLIVAGLLVGGVAAVALLQIYMDFGEMMRYTSGGRVVGNVPLPDAAYRADYPLSLASEFFVYKTRLLGPGHFYVGPIFIFFATAGIVLTTLKGKHKNWLFFILFSILIYCLISSFGKNLGFFYINQKIPLINKIRQSVRFMFVGNISITYFAALGFRELFANWDTEKRNKYILAGGVLFIGLILLYQMQVMRYKVPVYAYLLPFLVATIPVFLKNKWFSLALIIMLISANGLIMPEAVYSKAEGRGFTEPPNLASMNILQKISEQPNYQDYRLVSYDNKFLTKHQWGQNALYYDIKTFYSGITPVPNQQHLEVMKGGDNYPNLRRIQGAKWFVYPNKRKPAEGLDLLYKNKIYSVYENKNAIDKYYTVDKLKKADENWEITRDEIEKLDEKATSFAFVEQSDIRELRRHLKESKNAKKGQTKIEETHYSTNKIALEVKTKANKILLINEYFDDNWNLTIDGQSAEMYKANINQIAIPIEKGNHNIELKYRPTFYLFLYYAQKIAFVVIFVGLLFFTIKYIRTPKPSAVVISD